MNIIVEGPDNSGKSTLIESIKSMCQWPVVPSEGPEKYPGEIDQRIEHYSKTYPTNHIFDRHPAVSELMYCFLRGARGPSLISQNLFYSTLPLIVYCRPADDRGMAGHQLNEGIDTADHVMGVVDNYKTIWRKYDEWALHRAHLVYRIGDDKQRILTGLWGMLYG